MIARLLRGVLQHVNRFLTVVPGGEACNLVLLELSHLPRRSHSAVCQIP